MVFLEEAVLSQILEPNPLCFKYLENFWTEG